MKRFSANWILSNAYLNQVWIYWRSITKRQIHCKYQYDNELSIFGNSLIIWSWIIVPYDIFFFKDYTNISAKLFGSSYLKGLQYLFSKSINIKLICQEAQERSYDLPIVSCFICMNWHYPCYGLSLTCSKSCFYYCMITCCR